MAPSPEAQVVSYAARLIAAGYARRGMHELADVWRRHAVALEALEAREQAERDRRPLDERWRGRTSGVGSARYP